MRYTVKVQAEDSVSVDMEMTWGEHEAVARFVRLYTAQCAAEDATYPMTTISMELSKKVK